MSEMIQIRFIFFGGRLTFTSPINSLLIQFYNLSHIDCHQTNIIMDQIRFIFVFCVGWIALIPCSLIQLYISASIIFISYEQTYNWIKKDSFRFEYSIRGWRGSSEELMDHHWPFYSSLRILIDAILYTTKNFFHKHKIVSNMFHLNFEIQLWTQSL